MTVCFVDIEHESWLADPLKGERHRAYCLDVRVKLERILGIPCFVRRFTDVTRQLLEDLGTKALVISGNATDWDQYEEGSLEELYRILSETTWPVLGFCGGLQLIAMAHGAPVGPMRRLRPGEADVTTVSAPGFLKEWGYTPIEIVKPDPMFAGLGSPPVFLEAHYCEVKETPPGFELLASSADCRIQALRHVHKPIYGTQFHPEAYTEGPNDRRNSLVNLIYPDGHEVERADGQRLLANFARIAGLLC